MGAHALGRNLRNDAFDQLCRLERLHGIMHSIRLSGTRIPQYKRSDSSLSPEVYYVQIETMVCAYGTWQAWERGKV